MVYIFTQPSPNPSSMQRAVEGWSALSDSEADNLFTDYNAWPEERSNNGIMDVTMSIMEGHLEVRFLTWLLHLAVPDIALSPYPTPTLTRKWLICSIW